MPEIIASVLTVNQCSKLGIHFLTFTIWYVADQIQMVTNIPFSVIVFRFRSHFFTSTPKVTMPPSKKRKLALLNSGGTGGNLAWVVFICPDKAFQNRKRTASGIPPWSVPFLRQLSTETAIDKVNYRTCVHMVCRL